MDCSDTSHQDVTHNREATCGSLTRARLSGTFPQCDCIRLYLPSRETLSPDILSVRSLTWFGAWCGSFGFRSCGGQHSSLTWLLFVCKAEMPPLDKQRLEVSVSNAIRLAPPYCTFLCRSCILFRPSWPVCRESCAISWVALSAWWPLQARLCCCRGYGHMFVLWLDSPGHQLPGESKQPLNRGEKAPTLPPLVLPHPRYIYIYIYS